MLRECSKLQDVCYLDFWEGERFPSIKLGTWRVWKLLITVRTKIHSVIIYGTTLDDLSSFPPTLSHSPLLNFTSCLLRRAWHLNLRLITLTTPSMLSALVSTCHSVALVSGDSMLSAIPHTRCTHLYGNPYCRTAEENMSPPLFLIW